MAVPPAAPGEAAVPPAARAAATPQRRDTTLLRTFSDLRQDSLVSGQQVTVSARGAMLIVAGSVTSAAAYSRVMEIVARRAGSFSILDSLVVADPPPGAYPPHVADSPPVTGEEG